LRRPPGRGGGSDERLSFGCELIVFRFEAAASILGVSAPLGVGRSGGDGEVGTRRFEDDGWGVSEREGWDWRLAAVINGDEGVVVGGVGGIGFEERVK
jgi:hypothetical protein